MTVTPLSSAHAGERRPHGRLKQESRLLLGKGDWLIPPYRLGRLREPGLQEFAQLGSSLKLRNWLKFLERRGEGIRETPDRS